MKNYYDELEVSKTASKEVIEKAYKVLAKKYHPDITQEIDKKMAEEKFKIISEAYEILSNEDKRKNYDIELEKSNPTISYSEYQSIVNDRNNLKSQLYQYKNNTNQQHNQNNANNQHTQSNFQYNNPNSDYQYNTQRQYTQYNNSNKKKYYYTATGKPASAFAYFKYKIKEFFSNISLILLAILAIILAINAITPLNIFSFLKYL